MERGGRSCGRPGPIIVTRHVSLCEPSGAGVSGNTVADNHDRIAHSRIRARPEGARVGGHADRPSGNPQTWSARPEVRHARKSRIRSAYGYGCRRHPADRSSTSENARWRGKGSDRKDQRGCGRTRSARSRGSEAARTVRVRSGPGGDRVDRCRSHRRAEAKRSRGADSAPGRPDHHSRHAGSAAAGRARRLRFASSGQPFSRPGRSSPCSPCWPGRARSRRRRRSPSLEQSSSRTRAARAISSS